MRTAVQSQTHLCEVNSEVIIRKVHFCPRETDLLEVFHYFVVIHFKILCSLPVPYLVHLLLTPESFSWSLCEGTLTDKSLILEVVYRANNGKHSIAFLRFI